VLGLLTRHLAPGTCPLDGVHDATHHERGDRQLQYQAENEADHGTDHRTDHDEREEYADHDACSLVVPAHPHPLSTKDLPSRDITRL
jgi:hypothetical protein